MQHPHPSMLWDLPVHPNPHHAAMGPTPMGVSSPNLCFHPLHKQNKRLPPLPTYRECNLALNATLKTRAQIRDAVIKSLPLSAACCGAPSGHNRSPRISRSLCCASGCSQAIPGEERDKGSKQGLLLACGSLITCCLDVYSERQEVWIPLFFPPWLIFRRFLYRGREKEGGKCNRASRKASLGWCSTALHGVVPPTLPWPWDRAHS